MKDYAARHADVAATFAHLCPVVLPANVEVVDGGYHNARWWHVRAQGGTLTVCLEVEVVDGELWAHLSVSGPRRIPKWRELRSMKELFLRDRKAIQVLPKPDEYVNTNPCVLHLYSPLERDPVPDFRGTDMHGHFGI